ncbi:MAG: HAD family hydrolase [Methanomethylovorans sp.]|uniref:HAD family hydrolase n=1 Tax=Methanomethylovorans sp. TaxID=2758717 RepID=UPI000B011854|nr:HAD family hydrolase [Methanomethylovorans sp.]
MKKKIAVVFDSAGTLLRMYRVAKETSTGNILENIESTLLVAKRPRRALVVIHAEPVSVTSTDPRTELRKFIADNRLKIDISCSSGPISTEEAMKIINEQNVLVGDVIEVIDLVHRSCPENYYIAAGLIVDGQLQFIPYVLSTAGKLYSNAFRTIKILHSRDIDTYIASGDTMRSLRKVAEKLCIPLTNVFDIATTHEKANIVLALKEKYEIVLMIGDGLNDIRALEVADVGIVTTQQGDKRPQRLLEAADHVICDIIEVIDIVDSLSAYDHR